MSFHSVDPTTGATAPVAGLFSTSAGAISYSNTTSGLHSTKVQGAIDELASNEQTLTETKAEQTSLAPVQTTLVASQAYDIGEQFFYHNNLYKVTVAIAQGGTITIDGNCERAQYITHQFSFVGMIVHSTTLDTQDKVKKVYGGTTWIQHSGYFLRGASSGVVANSAAITGGEDTHTLTVDEMPSHTHTQNAHNHALYVSWEDSTHSHAGSASRNSVAEAPNPYDGVHTSRTTADKTATNQNTGGGQAHNNVPSYKSVYIWERTV